MNFAYCVAFASVFQCTALYKCHDFFVNLAVPVHAALWLV